MQIEFPSAAGCPSPPVEARSAQGRELRTALRSQGFLASTRVSHSKASALVCCCALLLPPVPCARRRNIEGPFRAHHSGNRERSGPGWLIREPPAERLQPSGQASSADELRTS